MLFFLNIYVWVIHLCTKHLLFRYIHSSKLRQYKQTTETDSWWNAYLQSIHLFKARTNIKTIEILCWLLHSTILKIQVYIHHLCMQSLGQWGFVMFCKCMSVFISTIYLAKWQNVEIAVNCFESTDLSLCKRNWLNKNKPIRASWRHSEESSSFI